MSREPSTVWLDDRTTVARAVRPPHLAEMTVIVDGMPGCGKTMLSPIVGALPRVELLQYAYETEHVCALAHLKLIDESAARTLIRLFIDTQLYNVMMARSTNFRPSDLSSVTMNARPLKYFRRLFSKGDEAVLDRIRTERPILHLTTHNLLGFSEPLFAALGPRVVIVEVVRHPLHMIRQQALYMGRYGSDVRDLTVWHTDGEGEPVPYFVRGREDRFRRANPWERAVLSMEIWSHHCDAVHRADPGRWDRQVLTVPFERFVLAPFSYMADIEQALGTTADAVTRRMMKKQRVPRRRVVAGRELPIYRQYGWRPPVAGSEVEELAERRAQAAQHLAPDSLDALDRLSTQYESTYLANLPDWSLPCAAQTPAPTTS